MKPPNKNLLNNNLYMNKQKGFIKILLIAIAIIAVAVFVYMRMVSKTEIIPSNITDDKTGISFQSNEKDSTADWKIYRNDKYGFEVKYPNNFVASRQTEDSLYLSSNQSCFEKRKLASPGYVGEGCLHPTVLVRDGRVVEEGVGVARDIIKIDGLNGERIINQSNKTGDEYASITIEFEKGGKWYVFNIINNPVDNKIAKDTIDKILSTFKFTK